MEDTRNGVLLQAIRASVVPATALVLMEGGWMFYGCILRLMGGSNPYFPNLPGFGVTGLSIIICGCVLLAMGQIIGLTGRSPVAGVIVGVFFLVIGLIGVCLTILSQILVGHDDGDSHSLTEMIVIQSFVASWLFIGLANLLGVRKLPDVKKPHRGGQVGE